MATTTMPAALLSFFGGDVERVPAGIRQVRVFVMERPETEKEAQSHCPLDSAGTGTLGGGKQWIG
jgi:hypothetical protein